MPPASNEEQFKFLISCIRYSNNGKVDFGEVAKECMIVSKGAAAKRYERMMKTHGIAQINTNTPNKNVSTPKTSPQKEGLGLASKKRKVDQFDDEDEDDVEVEYAADVKMELAADQQASPVKKEPGQAEIGQMGQVEMAPMAPMAPMAHVKMAPMSHVEMAPMAHVEMAPMAHVEMAPMGQVEMAQMGQAEMAQMGQAEIAQIGQAEMAQIGQVEMGQIGQVEMAQIGQAEPVKGEAGTRRGKAGTRRPRFDYGHLIPGSKNTHGVNPMPYMKMHRKPVDVSAKCMNQIRRNRLHSILTNDPMKFNHEAGQDEVTRFLDVNYLKTIKK